MSAVEFENKILQQMLVRQHRMRLIPLFVISILFALLFASQVLTVRNQNRLTRDMDSLYDATMFHEAAIRGVMQQATEARKEHAAILGQLRRLEIIIMQLEKEAR